MGTDSIASALAALAPVLRDTNLPIALRDKIADAYQAGLESEREAGRLGTAIENLAQAARTANAAIGAAEHAVAVLATAIEKQPPSHEDSKERSEAMRLRMIRGEVQTLAHESRHLLAVSRRSSNAAQFIESQQPSFSDPQAKLASDTANEAPSSTKAKFTKVARALATLAQHPDWSDEQIAEVAGCSRTSLYRMKLFVKAREAMKAKLPHGSKSKDGTVEAWSDGEDADDDEV
jgi:hypothetical protein